MLNSAPVFRAGAPALLGSMLAWSVLARAAAAAQDHQQLQLATEAVVFDGLDSPLPMGDEDVQRLGTQDLGRVCVDTSTAGVLTLCSRADESKLDFTKVCFASWSCAAPLCMRPCRPRAFL